MPAAQEDAMSWAVLGATLRRHHEIGLALAFVAMASYELLEMRALESSRASVAAEGASAASSCRRVADRSG